MIDKEELERYLHRHIPLSKAMDVRIETATPDSISLRAAFAPNINHEETVFGGSASAVAILSAWAMVYTRVKLAGVAGRIVIHANSMHYEKPMRGDFRATASAGEAAAWDKLFATLRRKRMARITIKSVLDCAGEESGALEGEFVVIPAP